MQPVVEQSADGAHATAGASLRLENDDRYTGLVKHIGCAQTGEAGADDHHGITGIERPCGYASNDRRDKRSATRHVPEKSPAIHVLPSNAATRVWDGRMMATEI
jgi:hypothetical protein